MARMSGFKARFSSIITAKPADYLYFDEKQQQLADEEDKMPQCTVTEITPPVSVKSASVTPATSVESTPKTSLDEEAYQPITATRINFACETLPEYSDMFAVQIDNVLSRAECSELLQQAEASAGSRGWERQAPNMNAGREVLYADTRKCGRIIWDSQAAIDKIWACISELPELQEILYLENNARVTGNGPARRNELWELTRPSDKMRFHKYAVNDYFRPHCDGTYESPDRKERSYFTMQLYLNDAGAPSSNQLRSMPREQRKAAQKNYLLGGNTTFHSYDGQRRFDIQPKAGSILIYQHRDLLHSSTDVIQGNKYTMRTDLLYRKV